MSEKLTLKDAVESLDYEQVWLLLQSGEKVDADSFDQALMSMCDKTRSNEEREQGYNITKLLIGNMDVNAQWNPSPLMKAGGAGQKQVVHDLLVLGANPNQTNEWGYTALYDCKNVDIARELVRYGADLNMIQNKAYNETVLDHAARNGWVDMVEYYTRENVKTTQNNMDLGYGVSAEKLLKCACEVENLSVARGVIYSVYDTNILNAQYRNGNTLLHMSVMADNTDLAKILLKKGVSTDIQNKFGLTVQDYLPSLSPEMQEVFEEVQKKGEPNDLQQSSADGTNLSNETSAKPNEASNETQSNGLMERLKSLGQPITQDQSVKEYNNPSIKDTEIYKNYDR